MRMAGASADIVDDGIRAPMSGPVSRTGGAETSVAHRLSGISSGDGRVIPDHDRAGGKDVYRDPSERRDRKSRCFVEPTGMAA